MKCSPAFPPFPYMLDHLECFHYTQRTKISIMLSCALLVVSLSLFQAARENSGLAELTTVEKL